MSLTSHESETERLGRLDRLGILDTPEDRHFSNLVEQALSIVDGASIAAISLIDRDRQWFKSIRGLNLKETPRSVSFCSHTIQTEGVMIVGDTLADERFSQNPLVTSTPNIRSYVGVKLMDGVGALCVIGMRPNQPSEGEVARLIKVAQFVNIQLLSHGTHFNIDKPVPSE